MTLHVQRLRFERHHVTRCRALSQARRCPVGKPRETITDDLTTAFVEALDKQLMDVGWERVKHVSDDLRRVVIVVR